MEFVIRLTEDQAVALLDLLNGHLGRFNFDEPLAEIWGKTTDALSGCYATLLPVTEEIPQEHGPDKLARMDSEVERLR